MTLFLPLDAESPAPPTPHFLVAAPKPSTKRSTKNATVSHKTLLDSVVKSILGAKRIVVVCGAGISVRAGIPDFRSADGLFQSLKKDNASISSGKDLFDARVFNSEQTMSQFYRMIANLSLLSTKASPTPFHNLLKSLDDKSQLLRVYSQNIDNVEEKAGLSSGIPLYDPRSRNAPKKEKDIGLVTPPSSASSTPPPARIETPRCIPLHGTLSSLHCTSCSHSLPLPPSVPLLLQGTPPACPQCTDLESTRQLVGKRLRGIGKLRPSVVLYGEDHREGEVIGEVVRRDLAGSGGKAGRGQMADLLIVVGTSLRVPGTKRIVKEFSKVIRTGTSTSRTSPGKASTSSAPVPWNGERPVKTMYLNLDFPVPGRDWEGVFDVWIQGDSQEFAEMVQTALEARESSRSSAKRKLSAEMASSVSGKARKKRRLLAEDAPTKRRARTASMESYSSKKRKYVETDLTPRKRSTQGVPTTPKTRRNVPLTPISLSRKHKPKSRVSTTSAIPPTSPHSLPSTSFSPRWPTSKPEVVITVWKGHSNYGGSPTSPTFPYRPTRLPSPQSLKKGDTSISGDTQEVFTRKKSLPLYTQGTPSSSRESSPLSSAPPTPRLDPLVLPLPLDDDLGTVFSRTDHSMLSDQSSLTSTDSMLLARTGSGRNCRNPQKLPPIVIPSKKARAQKRQTPTSTHAVVPEPPTSKPKRVILIVHPPAPLNND